MKRGRFTEEQEQEAGAKATDLGRKYGVTNTTFYRWKAKSPATAVAE